MPIADHIQRVKDNTVQEYNIDEKILWYEDDLNWGFAYITGYSRDGGVYEIRTPAGKETNVIDTHIIGKVDQFTPGDIHK